MLNQSNIEHERWERHRNVIKIVIECFPGAHYTSNEDLEYLDYIEAIKTGELAALCNTTEAHGSETISEMI